MTEPNSIVNNKFEYNTLKVLGGATLATIGTAAFAAAAFSLLAGIGALTPTLSAVTLAFVTLVPAAIAILTTNPVGWVILSSAVLLLTTLTIFGGIFLATRKKEMTSSTPEEISFTPVPEELASCRKFKDLGTLLNSYKKMDQKKYNTFVTCIKDNVYDALNDQCQDVPKRGDRNIENSLNQIITELEKNEFNPKKPNLFETALMWIKYQ